VVLLYHQVCGVMVNTCLNKRHLNFITVLILAFPIVINSIKIFSSLILLILVFFGAHAAFKDKANPFKIKELKLFSWLTVGYFGVALLSIPVADGIHADFSSLGRKIQFLLAPLIALSIFRVKFPIKNLLLSLKIGLIIIGIITITQALFQIGEYWRPSGMINPNIFGDIAVSMLFLSIIRIFNETPKERIFTLIAFLFGVTAITLSASRGSWVSALILSGMYFILIYQQHLKNNKKYKVIVFGLFVAILATISNTAVVQNKISAAISGVENWRTGDKHLSSTGERLNMWKSGLQAFTDSPWIGYGYGNANQASQNYTSQNIVRYSHLHNEYITTAVSAGIVGLLALLSLLFIPLRIFYQGLQNKKTYHYSLMGVLLCIGYATFGFTHIAFGEEHINAFYVFFLGILLPKVIKKEGLKSL